LLLRTRVRVRRYTKVLAVKKVSNGWGETLVRGIFANFLVVVATWQANAAQDLTGAAGRGVEPAGHALAAVVSAQARCPTSRCRHAVVPPRACAGKAVAVWLPISAFAMLGFEHCIGE
jgi:formate/nitrite transporter FocA (FNT family)